MKAEWSKYLKSIGIKGPFLKRVEEVLDFYQQVYPNQIQDIFVTEYLGNDGNREYESLWLFSETFAMEAKQFLKEKDDYDSVSLRQQVEYWTIKKTEYDFHKASTKSRMMLKFELLSGVGGTLKASQGNCDYLKAIFSKHIIPNAIECPVTAQQNGRRRRTVNKDTL